MWYDLFSHFYDRALQDLYAPFRQSVADALQVGEGAVVLDLPCGTGQGLDSLMPLVGPDGVVIAVDASSGMLKKAVRRAEREGWKNVVFRQALAADVDSDFLQEHLGVPQVDAVLCALGLTAFPDWELALAGMTNCLRPGGRFVAFDVHASKRSLQTLSVEMVARADLSREVCPALEAHCREVTRTVLSTDQKVFGGELYVVSGVRH